MSKYRLRDSLPFRTPDEERDYYARTYPDGYRHTAWGDHVERVKASADVIGKYRGQITSAADLSCGDGALLNLVSQGLEKAYLGDMNGVPLSAVAECRAAEVTNAGRTFLPGSLETFQERVDLFILSETLEHLPEPELTLSLISDVSRYLFLSTPLSEPVGSGNLEHYWGWSDTTLHSMLLASGWTPLEKKLLVPESTRDYADAYTFQLWMAVAE